MDFFVSMPLNSVHIVQGNLPQSARNIAVLRNGAVVSGRVISTNSNGTYSVSIAGQMIDVRSEANLQAGEFFSARVKITGNQIVLSLSQEANSSSGGLIQKFAPQNQNLSPQIQSFLSSLGFEPNMASFKILQFMQQIGMRIDVPAAKKALQSSKNNGQSAEEKAQISLLLEQKGIRSDDERVSAILGRNPRDSGGSNQREKQHQQEKKSAAPPRSAQNGADTVRNYFSQVDSASLTRSNGVLAAFNTLLSSHGKNSPLRHWIVLPFEWDFHDSFGNIKLLFDSGLRNLEKVIIDLRNAEKNRIFALNFRNKSLDSIRFASDDYSRNPQGSESDLLASLFGNSVHVERADFSELRGFCAGDETLALVEGTA